MKRHSAVLASLFLAAGLACASDARGQSDPADDRGAVACALVERDTRWIQTALDGWERVSRDFLRVDPSPLPWIVLFDRSCTWHLAPDAARLPEARPAYPGLTFAGEPVPVRVVRHDSAISLPNGSTTPVRGAAFASLYERGPREPEPFFVLALPEVWRETLARHANLETEMLGVASHELVHTRQLPLVARRIDALKERYTLPDRIHDDMVEERFAEVPGFRRAHEEETDLLYRAVSEPDLARKRALARQALQVIRTRQARYFRGPDAPYRELEELFLNMEGVAVWAAFELSRADPAFDIGIEDPAVDRARNSWSQDQGLALFLLVDELVPGWRGRVLGPEMASPFDLLEETVGGR